MPTSRNLLSRCAPCIRRIDNTVPNFMPRLEGYSAGCGGTCARQAWLAFDGFRVLGRWRISGFFGMRHEVSRGRWRATQDVSTSLPCS